MATIDELYKRQQELQEELSSASRKVGAAQSSFDSSQEALDELDQEERRPDSDSKRRRQKYSNGK